MKTYGFLVAIESDQSVTKEFIEDAISFYMDDDNHYKMWGSSRINVEALGLIDVYNEDGTKQEETN